MQGIIKREKHSIPFLPNFPKMTREYKLAVDDLFFSRNIQTIDPGDTVIFLGSPIMIKEEVLALGKLPIDESNLVVVSGGPSPAYRKFGPEFVGAALIEIFKGTFSFDLKEAESYRVRRRSYDRFPHLRRKINKNIFFEIFSTNTYENISRCGPVLKDHCDKVVLAATIEQIPRAIETLKTIVGPDVEARGLPYNPKIADKWDKSPLWRSRFNAEISRMQAYSDESNPKIKNHIKLSDETRAKLEKVRECSR
jgi:hypothetical protein